MVTVAFDSKLFRAGRGDKVFKALLGAGVTVEEADRFKSRYEEVLEDLFYRYGARPRRKVYKAAHLYTEFYDDTPRFMDELLSTLSAEIKQVDIFYTYYPMAKVPKIAVFSRSGKEVRTPVEFIDLIYNSYPHICAWGYLNAYPKTVNYEYRLDYFEGYGAPTWESIKTLPNLNIYYGGDECNALIATADIVSRVTDDKLKERRYSLNGESIKAVLSPIFKGGSVETHFLGPKGEYLSSMAPDIKMPINVRPKLKRPIVFLVRSEKAEKEIIEWSPVFCRVVDYASNADYAIKFFDLSRDIHIITENDIFVPLNGEDKIDRLKKLGFKINVLTEKELFFQNKK
jgi:hypothetical protein